MPDPSVAPPPRRLPQIWADGDDGRVFPTLRPRLAATLILLDTSGRETRVLMGRRHAAHRFMPGKFVFPGGRVEVGDHRMPAAGELPPATSEKLLKQPSRRASVTRARALALAAIRETFEETGLVLGVRSALAKPAPAGPWTLFSQLGVLPDLHDMHFIARAITPPRRPRRYDTHFFSLDAAAIAHRVDNVVTPESELVETLWVGLQDARRLDLPHITHAVLDELDARLAAGLPRDLAVPFFRPVRGHFRREEL